MDARQSTRKKPKTLLIADDEPNIRLLVKRTFEAEYIVLEATNGKQAVELALSSKPDLILMDIMMPQVDGLTALATLKGNQRTAAIPVVMLTGLGFELNEQHAASLGAKAYLRKPVTPRELLNTIRKII